MSDSSKELIKVIVHYQQCLDKYASRDDQPKILAYIAKLYKLPVTIDHLEKTGVGRTVNGLRKFGGEVGEAAKSLVTKWKEMVSENNEAPEPAVKPETNQIHPEEPKDKSHRDRNSSSSHDVSDKKNKHDYKEKSSGSHSNGVERHRVKEDRSKVKKHSRDDKKIDENKNHKHRSSKRKSSSEESEEEDYKKSRSSSHKRRSKEIDSDEDSSESDYHQEVRRHKKDDQKRKHDDSDKEYESSSAKRKKYSETEESDDSEIVERESKTESHKHSSKHKEKASTSSKKDKYSHKSHQSKREKESASEEKQKDKSNKSKYPSQDKYSSQDKLKSSSSSKKEKESSSKKSKHSSKHSHSDQKSSKKSSSGNKSDISLLENGIESGSGTSFAEALGMIAPVSSKANKKKVTNSLPVSQEKTVERTSSPFPKLEPVNLLEQKKLDPLPPPTVLSNLLPQITPNYKPIGLPLDNGYAKSKISTEEEALSAIIYSKISRTKVYSGNKVIWGEVPTLFDLCTRVLQDNIDALEYTGGVPYDVLKPVIERANPDQLFMLEHYNPYLIKDTDSLWQLHCQKEFRTKKREELETWRDMYMRCLDEREAKLKALTANIKQAQDKSLPVRQTKLAYVDSHAMVKPPRSIARKQAKHGTGGSSDKKPAITPTARAAALAVAGAAGQIAVPNPGAKAAASGGSHSSAAMKPKKAPLMQKTLAFMKNRLFRR